MLETAWESRWMPDSLWGCSSVGRAPALQAGGQEFESLHLHSWLYIAVRKQSFLTHVQARYENKTLRRLMKASFHKHSKHFVFAMYLENCILKIWYKVQTERFETNIKTSEVLHESVTKQTKNKQLLIVNTISQRCNAMHLRGTPYPRCESIG